MRTLNDIIKEIRDVCNQQPIMQDRINALRQAGYDKIHYVYVKHSKGLYGAIHLPKKHIFRIQIGYTELQKGYSAAWCIDLPSKDIVNEVELPF
jgi:hypothetical protein